jgi:hypothetical protein
MKRRGKKIILIYSNPVRSTLKDKAHLPIVSQQIKSFICGVKKGKETFSNYKKRTSP